MRKLYIQGKVFSITNKMDVYDETQTPVFQVESGLFTLGRQMHIYDMNGAERAQVNQKPFSIPPRFEVLIGGEMQAEIRRKFTFFRPEYEIEGTDWHVDGEVFAHDYSITNSSGTMVAQIHKAWLSWGDAYEVDIYQDYSEILVLATVLAIDTLLDQASHSSGSSSSNSR